MMMIRRRNLRDKQAEKNQCKDGEDEDDSCDIYTGETLSLTPKDFLFLK